MGWKFNPFTGALDQTGSGGGGGASYIDGEVATYNDLPLDGTAALNSAWLVREASGTWLLGRKPAGIYIRTATAGSSRDADYTYAGILPDVFSDANFLLYDNGDSTKNLQFQLSGISTGTTRTITVPNKNVTLDDAGDSRTPTAHAASHAAGGSDPLAPSDIGAQSAQDTETLSLSASVTLTASRNKLWKIANNTASNYFVELPITGISVGDIVEIEYTSSTGRVLEIRRDGVAIGQSLPTIARSSYRADTNLANGWTPIALNYSNAGFLFFTQGDVLLGRQGTSGQAQEISCSAAGRALLDDVDAAAQRTTLGLGTAATAATGDFAAASHSHELTALAATGATNGHVLTANGSNGVTFAALPASGVTGAASSASDVLGVSGANITGVDANADRIVFWDDSASALKYLEAGSGLSISGTTLSTTGGGVTTGSVDNAVIRADGTGGSTSQSSDINIEDASTTTQNNVAITNQHSGLTNSALVLTPKGTGAFIVGPRPDGTATGGGNARGTRAVDIQLERSAATQVASGLQSVAIGSRNTPQGNYAVSIGYNCLSNAAGVAIGVNAIGWSDGVGIGSGAKGDGDKNIGIGSNANATSSQSISIGDSAASSATSSIAIGTSAAASSVNSVAIGASQSANLRSGVFTRPIRAVFWGGETTNNTATVLNLDATATNRFTIAANTALAVDILLVARRSDVADKWLVARRFLGIRRDGSNNTSLIGTVQTLGTDQSAGSPTWTFSLTADDTNEALQLEVTGETSETVQWRATALYRVA